MLSNNMKRLTNVLSLYGKAVDVLCQKMGIIDDKIANAVNVLLYISTYMDFYKTNSLSIPEDEIALLIEAIEKFQDRKEFSWNRVVLRDIEDAEIPWEHVILRDLVSYLIILHDLYIQRAPKKEHFSKINQIIEQLPQDLLDAVHVSNSSMTADVVLRSKGKQMLQSSDFLLKKEGIITRAEKGICYLIEQQVMPFLEKIFNINDAISDEDLFLSFKAIVALYIYSRELDLKQEQVLYFIQILSERYSDKEKFVKTFLLAYQVFYNECENSYRNEISGLLEGVATVLPTLDKLLPPNKLSELIEELINRCDAKIFLKDPSSVRRSAQFCQEIDESYRIYETCLSFYVDIEQKNMNYDIFSEELISHLFLMLTKHAYLYPQFQVSGRSVTNSFRLLTSTCLTQLPPILQTELSSLFEKNEKWQEEFELFIEKFVQVNSKANEQQQRNIKLFFSNNQTVLLQIIQIMGVDGIRYLRNHLAGTVLSLERKLSLVPVLPEIAKNGLTEFFQKCPISFQSDPKEIDAVITSIIVLGMLTHMDDENTENYLTLSQEKSPQEYSCVLAKILLDKVFQGIEVTLSNEEINSIFERVSTEKLVSLIAASKNMLENEYRDVYLHLLKLDLFGGNISDFLHNTTQENNTGAGLAYHNKRIQKRLVKTGIVPEVALNYRKTLDFNILPSNTENNDNQEIISRVLIDYIRQLKEEIEKIGASNQSPQFSKLSVFVTTLENESKQFTDFFGTKVVKNLLGEINASLIALATDNTSLSREFNEFSEHAIEQYRLLKESKRNKEKEKKSYSFSIKQWNKEEMDTFFLGDAVGCCLATTGSQFQAMVQRRMDDAMLFHVAVDNTTKQPAALIWLYLAETVDKKIILVANFFEVNAKYATNDKLRLALLNGLLQFTHQYCQDNPNIKAFYMSKLNYGWNSQDLDNYTTVSVELSDKVGGSYIPGMSIEEIERFHDQSSENSKISIEIKAFSQRKYFLNSLSQTQFHKFEPKKLVSVNGAILEEEICEFSDGIEGSTSSVSQILQEMPEKHALLPSKPSINSVFDLCNLAKTLDNHNKNLLFNTFLACRDIYKVCVTGLSELLLIARTFPDHKNTLADHILKDSSEYSRLIKSLGDLIVFARGFPDHKNVLVDWILEDSDRYSQFIRSEFDFSLLSEELPQLQERKKLALSSETDTELENWKKSRSESPYSNATIINQQGTLNKAHRDSVVKDSEECTSLIGETRKTFP